MPVELLWGNSDFGCSFLHAHIRFYHWIQCGHLQKFYVNHCSVYQNHWDSPGRCLWGRRLQVGELSFLSGPHFGFRSAKLRVTRWTLCVFLLVATSVYKKKMLLGKRARPTMRRTTSMSSLGSDSSLELNPKEKQRPSQDCPSIKGTALGETVQGQAVALGIPIKKGVWWPLNGFGFPKPNRRKNPEPAHFLHACFLCKRRLVPGRDIYMYRGDSAFCSIECRHQQILLDERKEKRSVVVMKKESEPLNQHQNSSNQGSHSETAAAA